MFNVASLTLTLALAVGFVSAFPGEVIYSCKKPNTAAITFDDGPYNFNRDIEKMLNDAGAKGTFFLNGDNYGCIYSEQNQKNIRHLIKNGHQIASHTWAHDDLATLNWDELHDSFWKTELAIYRIGGVLPAFMRPPFGSFNDMVVEVAKVRGQAVAIWDMDSEDSVGATVSQSKKLYREKISQKPSNILTLNHETYDTTAYEVLPYAIQRLQKAGYQLVTLAECMGEEPYQEWTHGSTDGAWTC